MFRMTRRSPSTRRSEQAKTRSADPARACVVQATGSLSPRLERHHAALEVALLLVGGVAGEVAVPTGSVVVSLHEDLAAVQEPLAMTPDNLQPAGKVFIGRVLDKPRRLVE